MAAGNRKKKKKKFRQTFLLILTLKSHFEDTEQLCHSRSPDVTHDENSEIEIVLLPQNARYRAKELRRDIFLGNLSLNEGKISVGLPVLNFRIW